MLLFCTLLCELFCFLLLLSLDSHGTRHAGVMVCFAPWFLQSRCLFLLMGGSGRQCSASDVKSANVNLQKEGMYKRTLDVTFVFLSFFFKKNTLTAWLMLCFFCHHSHQSACSKKADGWIIAGLQWTATLFNVWKKEGKILRNWCQCSPNDQSCFFYISMFVRSDIFFFLVFLLFLLYFYPVD